MARASGTEKAASAPAAEVPAVRWPLVAALLLLLCVASALAVVYSAHGARERFRELEKLRRAENEIQGEWRQLLLERSTQSAHARVEAIATSELKMAPVSGEIRTVVAGK